MSSQPSLIATLSMPLKRLGFGTKLPRRRFIALFLGKNRVMAEAGRKKVAAGEDLNAVRGLKCCREERGEAMWHLSASRELGAGSRPRRSINVKQQTLLSSRLHEVQRR